MRPRTKRLVLAAVVAVVLAPFILGYVWWRHHYPYGMSHCCDLCLYFDLRDYAASHAEGFPKGEASPEASLSLLYRAKLAYPNGLRGKSVPEAVVKEILERGELLTPDTCGWHYVEGLRIDDDPRLALFWDKAGLDHNGGLLQNGGHIVVFVDGERREIPEVEWEEFMQQQRTLLAQPDKQIYKTFQKRHREVTEFIEAVYGYYSQAGHWPDSATANRLSPLPSGWNYSPENKAPYSYSAPFVELNGPCDISLRYAFGPSSSGQISRQWALSFGHSFGHSGKGFDADGVYEGKAPLPGT